MRKQPARRAGTHDAPTRRKKAEVADSKRRGKDAVEEDLDEVLDDDALDDDALSDDEEDDLLDDDDDDSESTSGRSATRTTTKKRGGGQTKVATEERRGNIFARLGRFVREIIAELRKVIWSTRRELLTYTTVVLLFVAVMMTIVAFADYGFAKLVLWTFGNGKK
jgi:preprotein translocase subunit SecE